MTSVVDASIVVSALLDDRSHVPLGRASLLESGTMHAPHLLDLEVVHAMRRAHRLGTASPERLDRAVERLRSLPVIRHEHVALVRQVWHLRDRLTAYDAAYVTLARALDAVLVTADGAMARAAHDLCDVQLVEVGG